MVEVVLVGTKRRLFIADTDDKYPEQIHQRINDQAHGQKGFVGAEGCFKGIFRTQDIEEINGDQCTQKQGAGIPQKDLIVFFIIEIIQGQQPQNCDHSQRKKGSGLKGKKLHQ